MKDKQVSSSDGGLGLFLLSTVVHCMSMTVLVYLRRSFGYVFLRPKSFFLACGWAFLLFAVYAWIDGEAWQTYRALLWFGLGDTVLYVVHLLATLRSEWRGNAEHDRFGGVSNFDRLAGKFGWVADGETFRLWGEPLLVVTVALLMRVGFKEHHLSAWLLVAAPCLWSKEALNRWLRLRQRKRRGDMLADAEDAFEGQPAAASPPKEAAMSRKSKVSRPRTLSSTSNKSDDA